MRDLRADEVEFTLTIEPEDMDVRGNALCSGDDAEAKAYENELIYRINRGDDAAWCIVVVTCRPKLDLLADCSGRDSLGGCTLGDHMLSGSECEREAWEVANAHGMKESALDDLNASLRRAVEWAGLVEKAL